MKRARRKRKPTVWQRGRNLLGSVTVLVALIGVVALLWSTLQTQRLVGLRQLRVDLVERVERASELRDRAEAQLEAARSYDVVAARARGELGMVECDPGRRTFVAMPSPPRPIEAGLIERFADGLDRMSRVRASFAAETEE